MSPVREVHKGDWGTVLELTCKDGSAVVPLTDATWIKLRLTDPDDVNVVKDMVISNPPGTDGKVKYTFVDGEIDLEDTWQYQVKVLFPGGFWQSDILEFTVYENLEESSASASVSASPSPSA
jgi:hypothetical protein